jgi:hypothetical protein
MDSIVGVRDSAVDLLPPHQVVDSAVIDAIAEVDAWYDTTPGYWSARRRRRRGRGGGGRVEVD